MTRLTTHVLDTASGAPGAGIAVRLYRLSPARELIAEAVTDADGRTTEPLLDEDGAGAFELEFDVGSYFGAAGEPGFLETVLVRVNLTEGERYHVPLLVSPWSYTTYRGS